MRDPFDKGRESEEPRGVRKAFPFFNTDVRAIFCPQWGGEDIAWVVEKIIQIKATSSGNGWGKQLDLVLVGSLEDGKLYKKNPS